MFKNVYPLHVSYDVSPEKHTTQFKSHSSQTLAQQISCYGDRYFQELKQLTPLKAQLTLPNDPCDRRTLPGHITASGIVVVKGKLLMIYHPFLKKWLQPGGHIEIGETPIEAAHRELFEETGIHGKPHEWHIRNPMPIDINAHSIPANAGKGEPEHVHYDFRYLFTSNGHIQGMAESDHKIAWMDADEIEEPNLKSLIEKIKSEGIFI